MPPPRSPRKRSAQGLTRPPREHSTPAASSTSTEPTLEPTSTEERPDEPGQPRRTEQPVLYTPEEAAELLRLRASWLRRKASARAIPCRFIGKHLRFARADLEAIAGINFHTDHGPHRS